MSVSIVSKVHYRLKKQGPFGLFIVSLIKCGVYLQRLGNRFEHGHVGLTTLPSTIKSHSFPGILEVIRQSYLPSKRAEIDETADFQDTIAWIVPHFSRGSGGHTTLFRFVSGLEKLGLKNKVYILNDMQTVLSGARLKEEICEYFSPIEGEVEVITAKDMARKADIVVCTSWQTAYAAKTWHARRKLYFVQDYEPFFSPVGSYYHFAEETYRMGFEFFTAGPWLLKKLKDSFLGTGDFFYLCPDRRVYHPRSEFTLPELKEHEAMDPQRKTFRIGLYNRASTPRRCVEIVWVALSILAEQDKDIIVFTFGDDENRKLPFPHKNLGILNHDELAEVYSFTDIVIAPSATNLSLLAREVMACGGVVVDLQGENTALELHDRNNAILVRPEVADFHDTIVQLMEYPSILSSLKESIQKSLDELPNWDSQVEKMFDFVRKDPE
jgi:hypothetical protein